MTENTGGAAKPAKRGWSDRVHFAWGHRRFALVPHDVLTTGGAAAREVARKVFPDAELTVDELQGAAGYVRLRGVPEPLRLVPELQRAGLVAQPNHVFFAHGDGCCCGPHPALTWAGGPVGSPPGAGRPFASPAYASAVEASPAYASPAYASGHRHSTARPAASPYVEIAASRLAAARQATKGAAVVVLDTGLASTRFRPAAVSAMAALVAAPGTSDDDRPDGDHDGELDPAAGHGTFIAGIIEQVAPGAEVTVQRVLHAQGDGDEVQIADAIYALPDPPAGGAILNLSFGGYVMDHPGVLAAAVADAQHRGYVVVASAGNDATCQPSYPAALPDVVAVGAVGPDGPAPFTNYGSWVRACAPGVDLVSTFFKGWNGHEPVTAGVDPDDFDGWACWSGTSFAAPVVAATLAREMTTNHCTAQEAVTRLIDQPALLRLPGLGTVINTF